MKRVMIDELEEGMCISQDVLTESGAFVMPRDTLVTNAIIKRLDTYHIPFVYIDDNNGFQFENIKDTDEFKEFQKTYDDVTDSMQNSFSDIITRNADDSKVRGLIDKGYDFYKQSGDKSNVLDMLHAMREYSDSTFLHSLNVAMIASIIAKWLKWSEKDEETVFTAGLFHDIGKLLIPPEILHKPGKLSDDEYAIMKTHPIRGLEILKDYPLSSDILRGVVEHHERFDGSGYPFGKKGTDINRFARVLAISDVYDAMTATRVYRGPVCPFDVISIFESEGLHYYDTEYVLTFISNVMETYMHSKVILSNGQNAEIIMINKTMRSRPLVVTDHGKFIDLAHVKDIRIDSIVG